jgi:hypothetical protein
MAASRLGFGGNAVKLTTYRLAACVVSIAAFSLAGCAGGAGAKVQSAKRVESGYDAGSTQIAVLGVAPWQDVAAALNPNFQLTGEQALTKTLATTQLFSSQMIDAMNASLTAGLPTISTTSTQTTSQSTDKPEPQVFYSATTTKAPGVAPAAGTALSTTKPGALGPLASFTPGVEASVQYATAASLFQEVQLLNRQTQMPMLRKGYRPYLVRLQVTVMPNARGMPYDTYADIAFMAPRPEGPATIAASAPAPIVVPLLATDVAEQSLQSRAAEILRQLSLNVTGQVNGAGLAAGLGRARDDLAQALGTDINAVSTVARVNDNTMRVRLGAVNTGSSRYSILPRANVVTVLLLIPKEKTLGYTPASVPVVMHTWFRDAQSGARLPAVGATFDEDRVAFLKEVIAKTGMTYGFDAYCANSPIYHAYARYVLAVETAKQKAKASGLPAPAPPPSPQQPDERLTVSLGEAADARLCKKTTSAATYGLNAEEWAGQFLYALGGRTSTGTFGDFRGNLEALRLEYFADALWVNLAHLFGSTSDASATAFLPVVVPQSLPPSQQALLLDDGAAQASATLVGARGLKADQLSATLVTTSAPVVTVPASSLQMSGGNILVAFPSPKAWSLAGDGTPILTGAIRLRAANGDGEIVTCVAPTDAQPAPAVADEPPKECGQDFAVSYRFKAADLKLAYNLVTPVNTVVIQEKGVGAFTFAIKRNKAIADDKAATTLRADGAVITSVSNALAEDKDYSWKLGSEGLVTVNLAQLLPGQKFNLVLKSANEASQTITVEAKAQETAKSDKESK